jgi:cell division protein FtsI/penicillin-binding protein 2
VDILHEWNSDAGKDLRTTIDLQMQKAAHRALAKVPGTAALVAIDTRTGEVLVLASQPTSGLPAAFASYYAPGSTFKIVTATAALMAGSTPQSPVQCSKTYNVEGRVFKNAEDAPDTTASLTDVFAESCNTAFIRLEEELPDGALQKAAELYGFNGPAPLPVSSKGGSMPAPASKVEAAADSIGQGKVEASPLQMASVAAGVASGTWHQPRIVADCPDCVSHEIPVAKQVQPLMRAVVTSGTGTAAAGVPGGPVYAKTGTAEFGSGSPPKTHAWFVGYQGDIAFAVFVERGAYGGTVAAPIAAAFLTSVQGR